MGAASARSKRLAVAALAAALALGAFAEPPRPAEEPRLGQQGKDVIWLPTPDETVEKMLDLAQLKPGERLVDLGSGDGKIAIAAAKRGASAKGIEYNPDMVAFSRRRAREAGVQVELVQGDIFESDFSDADVVTLYLLTQLNERLRPTLLAMKPGTRVVSYRFAMGGWEPDGTVTGERFDAYLWRVPAKVEGDWMVRVGNREGPALRLEQEFQRLEGKAVWGSRASPLREATLRGPVVSFVATDEAGVAHRFEGVADHAGPMMGVVTPVAGGASRLFTATRGSRPAAHVPGPGSQ